MSWKTLGGLLVVTEDEPKKEEQKVTQTVAAPTNFPQSVQFGQNNFTVQPTQVVSEKFTKHFLELFDSANLPGPDYFELSQALLNMPAGIDQASAIKMVYATLSTMGLTKTKLLTSIDQYLQVIEDDATNFNKDAQLKEDQEIGAELRAIEALKKQELDLQEQIAKIQQTIQQKSASIQEAQVKLESNKQQYQIAYTQFKAKLNSDKQIISQSI